jgi:hypothetical protein
MAQLSTLRPHAVTAIAKAARAEGSMFENPLYIKSLPEPSQYFMLYHPSGNVTHFVQLAHCESNCISLQAERQLQCPCRSCCGEFELVVPGRNDASAPLAKILSASFQISCPETFTIARAWIVHESKDCLDSRCIKR